MVTLAERLAEREVPPRDSEWLHHLVGDWQLLADLTFGDLILWVRDAADRWDAVAHVRSTTGQSVFYEDQVGRSARRERAAHLAEACRTMAIIEAPTTLVRDDLRVREECVPVVHRGRVVAVLTRHTNLFALRTPSRLELTYFATADAIARMIAQGEFPHVGATSTGLLRGAPRVGDGVIRLDADGVVNYASPNATSAMHRLGFIREVVGHDLSETVTSVLRGTGQVDEGLAFVLTGKQPWRTEVANGSAIVAMRSVPLREAGQRVGAVVLVRDVTELRRQERALLTKDATIREVHHRVKNNLQSVAALLRLQGRRVQAPEAVQALTEAERRVRTIALVHDSLSHSFDEAVDFDEVIDQGFRQMAEFAGSEHPVERARHGSWGQIAPDDATPLVLVMSELFQNSLEHGAEPDGTVRITTTIERSPHADGRDLLRAVFEDTGPGLPPGRVGTGLGTRIVQSFAGDLGGQVTWSAAEPTGTRATLTALVQRVMP